MIIPQGLSEASSGFKRQLSGYPTYGGVRRERGTCHRDMSAREDAKQANSVHTLINIK